MVPAESPSYKITSYDRVIVQGRYLVYEANPSHRFLVKGMAFPVPLDIDSYNEEGWIAVLKQLRGWSSDLNTLRIYQMNVKHHDYSRFLQAAADFGFYLFLPLTTIAGDGLLNRNLAAPKCYTRELYRYGQTVVDVTGPYHNVIGGILGNEVMNSLESWKAAPCVLAYARDLKRTMITNNSSGFALMYTMQHDAIGAVLTAAETVALTEQYLTECGGDDSFSSGGIDLLGINIETWCSSRQEFATNEDDSLGPYLDLYQTLHNRTTVPLLFSELGCSKVEFNRDNGLIKGSRDWKQLSVILGRDMVDTWSGFIAYAYDGPTDFRIMAGGPWKGVDPLQPTTRDAENLLHELKDAALISNNMVTISTKTTRNDTFIRRHSGDTCDSSIMAQLQNCCNIHLVALNDVPSYYNMRPILHALSPDDSGAGVWWILGAVAMLYILSCFWRCFCHCRSYALAPPIDTSSSSLQHGMSIVKNYSTFS